MIYEHHTYDLIILFWPAQSSVQHAVLGVLSNADSRSPRHVFWEFHHCYSSSFIVTVLARKWGSMVHGAFLLDHHCSSVVRTKMSAAIALWRQPPGILTSKAWTLWLHTYFTCGPGQQQDMETSVDHLSSQRTQVMTCPLMSFAWAECKCNWAVCWEFPVGCFDCGLSVLGKYSSIAAWLLVMPWIWPETSVWICYILDSSSENTSEWHKETHAL